jgi:hypothetical protein
MKQNHHPKHDEHLALGMIAAYAGGMLVMAILLGFVAYGGTYYYEPDPNYSQAALEQCPPEGISAEEYQWYINTGACDQY